MLKARYIALTLGLACSMILPSAWAARSLVVTVYPHDELAGISDKQLQDDYFQHWLDEMRSFTQHPIEVIFQRAIRGLTDIDYRAMSSTQILDAFTEEITTQRSARPFSFMNKDLLLTKDSYDRSGLNFVAGLAHFNGNTGIASMVTYAAPGHELGHMLSATHDNAKTEFNGWFCETYMVPNRVPLRSNCYRYSDQNRAAIADYLKHNSN
ncbi:MULTISPECIES: hypothetical protein [Pseudomonas]|uniref:hypothetical protein n=1 Tax=Pseudomonas TaxID=286 RepID=UPI00218A193C|nr:hypothetical protein [Pseudomonas sp. LRP2-20]BDM25505.1 hypothetical protein KMS_R52610 [Pseudomonas sp. LRP2-20]